MDLRHPYPGSGTPDGGDLAATMGGNVQKVLNNVGPSARILVFVHNGHFVWKVVVFSGHKEMDAGAHGIARLAKAAHAPLVGRVTLSAPPVLVTHLLVEHLARFRAEHSDIKLALSAQGQQISLSRREADVAVRLVRPDEAGITTRKIGMMAFGLYAHRSYAYLAAPELWQFIAFDQNYADMPQQQWLLGVGGDRPVACELNHISEHLIAVRAGVGVAGLPCFIGDRDHDLVRISKDVPPFARGIWLLVHRDLRRSPAVRAVMDFVALVISEQRDLSIRQGLSCAHRTSTGRAPVSNHTRDSKIGRGAQRASLPT